MSSVQPDQTNRTSDGPTVNERQETSDESITLEQLSEQLNVPHPDTHNFPLTDRGIGPEAYIGEKL